MNRSAAGRVSVILHAGALTGLLLVAASAARADTATGIVFHDRNANRRPDPDEPRLSGIRVSNGTQIVRTDEQGRYRLPVEDDDTIFVIKPSGWQVPLNRDWLPQFYYVHKPQGAPPSRFPGVAPTGPLPESIDFPLTPQEEPDEFRLILFGDTQPRNQQEVDWMAHDVIEDLIGTDASFGVTLGDIVFDDLSVMEPHNRTVALLGIPWYNVIGNHDINQDARDRRFVNETFERVYGPSWYSFDYGPTHFLVVDNIDWVYDSAAGQGEYRGGLGEEQLAFIETDLKQIPPDQMVVLMMHIPLTETHDRHRLYRLIEQRPFCISISGHTHYHEHVWITRDDGWQGPRPHHHIINVTVCGSWWSGAPDERGIPHTTMADGAPNGYTLLSFSGTEYRLDFRAAGRSADYQMEIDAPDAVRQAELSDVTVSANVFNGSEKSTVELRIDEGPWRKMVRTRRVDPKYQRVYDREAALLAEREAWRPLAAPKPSSHLWQIGLPGDLSAGTHLLHVRWTDRHGRKVTGRRVLRVVP